MWTVSAIAQNCTSMAEAAAKVERRMRKSSAAVYFSKHVGKQYRAIVTGSGDKGTWVRLQDPPIEGKLVKGYEGIDVGDRLTVKLVHVNIPLGFIDFARV